MSSNSSYIADLNLLAPPPPISSDDLSAEDFEFWRNARFIEMPPRLETDDELAATDVVDLEDSGPAESSAATAATATPAAAATPAQSFSGLELMGLSNMTPTAAATAAALAMSPLFAFTPMATQTLQQQLLLPSVGSAAPAAPTGANGYPTIYPAPPVPVSNVAGSNDTADVNALGSIQPKPPARKSSSTSRRSTLRPTTINAEAKASDAGTIDTDLVAKIASEEDKRRRNTAASARFRIKKKMKEQALEHTAREMTEKVQQLQERVKELELENKWLRELIVEKDPVLLDYGRSGKRKRAAPSSVHDVEDDDDDDDDDEEDEVEERDKRKGKKKNTISVIKEVNRNRNDHVKKQDQKRPKRNKKEVQEAKPEEEVIKPGLIKVEQLDNEDEKPI